MSYNNTFACSSLNFHEYPAFCRYFTLTPQVLFGFKKFSSPAFPSGVGRGHSSTGYEPCYCRGNIVMQRTCVVDCIPGFKANR